MPYDPALVAEAKAWFKKAAADPRAAEPPRDSHTESKSVGADLS